MRQRSYTHRRPRRRLEPTSSEETRCQLAVIVAVQFGLCCVVALLVPENPMLERLLSSLAQYLGLVVGYYFGQKGR
jgi:hypothetical protein